MKSERGSLTYLGVILMASLLLLAGTLYSANNLYLQQRHLKSIADALALDLADLLRAQAVDVVRDKAEAELFILSTRNSPPNLVKLDFVDEHTVSLRLCQPPIEPLLRLQTAKADVCASASATLKN